MTLQTILNPLIRESKEVKGAKWIFPRPQNLEQEYKVEYKLHIIKMIGNIFPTFQDFEKACKTGKPFTITPELDSRIANRSHTQSKEELLGMIRTFRSYPEFRNEKTVQNLYDRMSSGGELDMPILLKKRNTSRVLVMSGNTRMDVAFQMGDNPKCLVVEY